jgi:hypothetical protein
VAREPASRSRTGTFITTDQAVGRHWLCEVPDGRYGRLPIRPPVLLVAQLHGASPQRPDESLMRATVAAHAFTDHQRVAGFDETGYPTGTAGRDVPSDVTRDRPINRRGGVPRPIRHRFVFASACWLRWSPM